MSITNGTNITSIEKPAVGIDTGPGWATALNNSLDAIDAHDHTTNKGSRITPAALNINADVEFNENQLTEVKGVVLSQSNASSTNAAVYSTSGNLYWRNASGVAVQITDGSGVKSGAGSIDNMGSDAGNQAGASYSDTSKSFSFFTDQGNSDMGKMNHADLNLYKFSDNNTADTDYITLQASSSISGAGGTITVPGETGTMLTTATSFAGAISIGATGGSGSITLDAQTDINLDSDSGVINFKDGGTAIGKISNSSSDLVIENEVDAKDIIFKQYDGNEVVRMADDRRLYFFDKGGEYIYGDGSTLYIIAGSSVNFSSGTLSSINDLNTDAISVDDAAVGLNVDFSGGNNTTSKITLKDNVADALNITEGSNSYIKFVTTDSSEQIVFGKNSTFASTTIADLGTVTTADINGGTWQGTIDGNWTAASQTCADLGSVTTCDINGGTINGITDLAVADGGTGASSASDARTNLGLVIGTDVFTQRTITGTSNQISVSNGNGASGNPTISLPAQVQLGDASYVKTDEIRAHDGAGLKLRDSGGSDGIIIENGGFVGIGIDDPNNQLHVEGDSNYLLYVKQTGSVIHMMALRGPSSAGLDIACDGSSNRVLFNSINSNDAMEFAVQDGTVEMSIASNGVISGDFNDTSDIGLKENIKSLESGALSKINLLRPVSFDWKGKKNSTVGFIAQEVEKIFPSEVFGENYKEEKIEGYSVNTGKAINTIGIVAHLTKAIQELSAKVTALEGA